MDRKNANPAYIEQLSRLLHPLAHAVAGVAAATIITSPNATNIIAAVVGGWLPDVLDDPQMGLEIQHRTISHSIMAVLVMSLFGMTAPRSETIGAAFVAGYASHLIIDLTHGMGIMLWYPMSRSMVTVGNAPHWVSVALSATLIMYNVTAPISVAAAIMPPTQTVTPTRTVTPTLTPTPTPTTTATVTATRTPPPSYDVPLAAAAWQRAAIVASNTCRKNGERNNACLVARADEQTALLKYCEAAALQVNECTPPTQTPTPTRTPPPTTPPAKKAAYLHTPLCQTFEWIPCN